MNKIKNLSECSKSELDLFKLPPLNTSVEKGGWSEHSGDCKSNNESIRIDVEGSDDYIDLSNVTLYLKIKVYPKGKEEEGLDENAKIGLVNNTLHSMFSQIELKLNNVTVENSNTHYPYKSIFRELLNHGKDTQMSYLSSNFFYKDTPGAMDSVDLYTAENIKVKKNFNEGFLKRRQILINGKGTVEFKGRLHCDLFNTNKYLINYTTLSVLLTKNSDNFILMGEGDYEVKILEAKLCVRKVKVSTSVQLAHNLALEKSFINYYIKNSKIVTRKITSSGNIESQNICKGLLPTRIIIGLVESRAVFGQKDKNPFNFKHFDLSEVNLTVNEKSSPYHSVMKLDFDKNLYLNAYFTIYEGIDKPELGNNISREEYPKGYTLFAFDLSPDLCTGEHINIQNSGQIDIQLSFSKTFSDPILLIAYLEFDKIIYLNKLRQVESDKLDKS